MTIKNDEIRFRFLFGLYQKNNGEHTSELIHPKDIFKSVGLDEVEEKSLIQEITYLNKEGLIGGDFTDGKLLPAYVSTTNWGIETIEEIMSESLAYYIQKSNNDIKDEIKQIEKKESLPKQYLNLWEYSQRDSKLREIINEKIAKLISDPEF